MWSTTSTGGATATFCYNYNGGNCTGPVIEPNDQCHCTVYLNLTRYNSIRLNRP